MTEPPGTLNAHGRPLWLALAVLAVAHSPLVASYAAALWGEPHYQFFPALLIAVAIIGWKRSRAAGTLVGPPAAMVSLALSAHALVLVIAFLFASPWVAAASFLVLGLTGAWALGGTQLVRRLLTTWLPLLLLVRPPFDTDRKILTWLQLVTSRWASVGLDTLGRLHCHSGNVIRSGGREFFVEDACSGINSLLTMLCAIALYVVWNRRGFLISTLLVMGSVWWVVIANVVRVVLVVELSARYEWPMAEEPIHGLLGMALFGVALVLVWSTEQLLMVLLPDTWARGLAPPVVSHGVTRLEHARFGVGRALVLCLLPTMVLAGHAGLEVSGGPTDATESEVPVLDRSVMADEVDGWRVVSHHARERNRDSLNGQFSQEWAIQRGGYVSQLSLDYLFTERHDLAICYRGQGWVVAGSREFPLVEGRGDAVVRELILTAHGGGRNAVVTYLHFDERLEPIPYEILSVGDRLSKRLYQLHAMLAGLELSSPPVARRIYQLQLFTRSYQPLSEDLSRALRKQLAACFGSIRSRWHRAEQDR